MAGLALHPRLAHMLLRARALGHGALACDLAALLGERDILRGDGGPPDADVRLRVDALRECGGGRGAGRHAGAAVDRDACRRAAADARQWRERLGIRGDSPTDVEACGLLLAFAYPDRIAQRRPGGGGRYLLRNGRGAALTGAQALGGAPYLVAADVDGQGRESRIYLAAPLPEADLEEHFGGEVVRETAVEWDADARTVRAWRRDRLGAIVLAESPVRDPDPDAVAAAIAEGIAREGLGVLPWTDAALRLRERLAFLHAHDASWPDVSDSALLATLPEWLGPRLAGVRWGDELARIDVADALLGRLDWQQRSALDQLAPTHLTVPSGSRIPIDYADAEAPVLAVRLQEMFGLAETPRIFRGTVPLMLHLLSPAHRPVQVTRDLGGFWRGSYFEVRKDLRGRYPKHHWPDDPLQAVPTARAKPRTP
jgi:ATP-dependent helicase HrpB